MQKKTNGGFSTKHENARDILVNTAFAMVLSTREQHIRHEKATSNICSNKAFGTTLVEALQTFGNGAQKSVAAAKIFQSLLSQTPLSIPSFDLDTLRNYYKELGELNLFHDYACYPRGSCTMKYNPLLCDEFVSLDGFARVHPQTPEADAQGCLEVLWNFTEALKSITILDTVALQPVAETQGELCALKIFQARHADFSNIVSNVILILSTAHGTNLASTMVTDFEPQNIFHVAHISVAIISLESLKEGVAKYGSRIAAIIITNLNTSGIREKDFAVITKLIHYVGSYIFMVGANFNAVGGQVDLKALGFDAMHNNIHKTWAVSLDRGGPIGGFFALDSKFADYIPSYVLAKSANGNSSHLRSKKSIGSLHRNFGNFAHKIRALSYMLRLGNDGVHRMSATEVLVSRYLLKRLTRTWDSLSRKVTLKQRMHEFIFRLSKDAPSALVEHQVAERDFATRIDEITANKVPILSERRDKTFRFAEKRNRTGETFKNEPCRNL